MINLDLPLNEEANIRIDREPINSDKKKKFRLNSRNYFLTYPKCPISKHDVLTHLNSLFKNVIYLVVSQELHLDGDPHLHSLIMLDDKKDIKNQFFFDINEFGCTYHPNVQAARDVGDVNDYVLKHDKEPAIIGLYKSKSTSIKEGMERAMQNALILSKPLHELVDDGSVSIYSYKVLRENINAYKIDKIKVPTYQKKDCIWIVGGTGIGKSRWVRDNYPDQFYPKQQNKWWDGYNSEKIILIDDLDHQGACLGHHLKIWGDDYDFIAEVKGGSIRPIIERVIITSQYTPRDIWCYGTDESKWDPELVKAIERRFRLMTIENDHDLILYPN